MMEGSRVDDYLSAFVETGWTDLEHACDRVFWAELQAMDKCACAAYRIRLHLLRTGFVATDTQLRATAYGLSPILDLVGFYPSGAIGIVEIKCGEHANATVSTGPMLVPFHQIACSGRTICLLQLAVQFVCLKQCLAVASLKAGTEGERPSRFMPSKEIQPRNSHLLIYSLMDSDTSANHSNSSGTSKTPSFPFKIRMHPLPPALPDLVEMNLADL